MRNKTNVYISINETDNKRPLMSALGTSNAPQYLGIIIKYLTD